MLEKDALRQNEECKSSSAASTSCPPPLPPPPHHSSPPSPTTLPSSSSLTSFSAHPHRVGRFPPPFLKKKKINICFIVQIFNRRQDLSLLLSCIGLNHKNYPVRSPPPLVARVSISYNYIMLCFSHTSSSPSPNPAPSSSFFVFLLSFISIFFSFRVAVVDAVTDLPNLSVKLFLHSSGNITAKFAYHQILVDAFHKVPKASWIAKERVWLFPISSLPLAKKMLSEIKGAHVEVLSIDHLGQSALASTACASDLRDHYDQIPIFIESKLLHFQYDGVRFMLQHGG